MYYQIYGMCQVLMPPIFHLPQSIYMKILIVYNQCLRAALHLLQGFKMKIEGGHQLKSLIQRSKMAVSLFFSYLDEGYKFIII